jgi:hypothetical protein
MIRFVGDPRNGNFMTIVHSSAELRDAVAHNQLAVVLGMEVDKLGNFGKPGVVTIPQTVRAPKSSMDPSQSSSQDFYSRFAADTGEFRIGGRQTTGNHTWDYVLEGGVSHYGLMPEFLFDVKSSPNGPEVIDSLMQSAEQFAQMWAKAERAAPGISALPSRAGPAYALAGINGRRGHATRRTTRRAAARAR